MIQPRLFTGILVLLVLAVPCLSCAEPVSIHLQMNMQETFRVDFLGNGDPYTVDIKYIRNEKTFRPFIMKITGKGEEAKYYLSSGYVRVVKVRGGDKEDIVWHTNEGNGNFLSAFRVIGHDGTMIRPLLDEAGIFGLRHEIHGGRLSVGGNTLVLSYYTVSGTEKPKAQWTRINYQVEIDWDPQTASFVVGEPEEV